MPAPQWQSGARRLIGTTHAIGRTYDPYCERQDSRPKRGSQQEPQRVPGHMRWVNVGQSKSEPVHTRHTLPDQPILFVGREVEPCELTAPDFQNDIDVLEGRCHLNIRGAQLGLCDLGSGRAARA